MYAFLLHFCCTHVCIIPLGFLRGMKNMKIKELVLASIAVTTFAAVTIAITQTGKESISFNRVAAAQQNFTFNSQTGSTYWSSNNSGMKTITRSENPYNNILAGQITHGYVFRTYYGNSGAFLRMEYAISNETYTYRVGDKDYPRKTTYQFVVGVNNLQSFSMLFRSRYSDVYVNQPEKFNYTITATFYGETFDLDWYLKYENSSKRIADPIEFHGDSIVHNQQYEVAWTKTNEQYVVRNIVFFVEITSLNNSVSPDTYFDWYFESLTLNWSC